MKTLILKVAVNVGNTSFSGFSLQFFLLQILSKSPSDSVVVTYCWSYFKIFWVLDNFWQPESGNVIFDQKIFRGLSETSNKFDIRPSFGCLNIFVRSVWKEAVESWKRTALWFCPRVWKYVWMYMGLWFDSKATIQMMQLLLWSIVVSVTPLVVMICNGSRCWSQGDIWIGSFVTPLLNISLTATFLVWLKRHYSQKNHCNDNGNDFSD